MIHRVLNIGTWVVDFLFSVGDYDIDGVLACLYDVGAPAGVMREAERLMRSCSADCGFTYSEPERFDYINAEAHRAVVLIGPASSGGEFLDTFVHEIYHLAVVIAGELGVDLDGESPAYLAGDSARSLIDVVCRLGCPCCNEGPRRGD